MGKDMRRQLRPMAGVPLVDAIAQRGQATVRHARHIGKVPDLIWSIAIGLSVLALAELSAHNEWMSRLVLPAPSAVLTTLYSGIVVGAYVAPLQSTLTAMLSGFAIASVSAMIVAGLIASVPRLESILMPYIVAITTTPKMALAPLIVLLLGFDVAAKTAFVILVSFFPVFVNCLEGLRIRERRYLELAQSLGASRFQLFRYIRLPAAVPYLFAGLHIGVIFALIGTVVIEIVGQKQGLGVMLIQQKALFNVPGVWAVLLILMALGLTFHTVMKVLQRRIAFWAQETGVVAP